MSKEFLCACIHLIKVKRYFCYLYAMSKLSLMLYYVNLKMTQICKGISDKFVNLEFGGKFKQSMAD